LLRAKEDLWLEIDTSAMPSNQDMSGLEIYIAQFAEGSHPILRCVLKIRWCEVTLPAGRQGNDRR
jgi:hypothetical protein